MGTPPQDDPRYVWHAPDGLRAIAATALGCMQACAEKLGVIEASCASAIIGVLSPVSSHCMFSCISSISWFHLYALFPSAPHQPVPANRESPFSQSLFP